MLFLFVVFIAVIIVYEDFKFRQIHLISLLAFGLALVFMKGGVQHWDVVMNIGYLVLVLGLSFLVMAIRNKAWVNPFRAYLGLGDVILMLSFCFWFSVVSFILFNVISMLVAILAHVALSGVSARYKKHKTIPFAGMQVCCFIGYLLVLKIQVYVN